MKPLVFLLEDNIFTSELIQFILVEVGFEVIECNTISSLSDLLISNLPDLLIMDIHLPDGNGKEKCIEIRSNSMYNKMPILLMSAEDNATHFENEFNRLKFIQKPFSLNHFYDVITSLLIDDKVFQHN